MRRFPNARILMYSHDTFGLGHIRRCRTIAHSLVGDFRGLQVLIISGASIAGAFDYRSRVDFVKVPSVIKLRNGEYTSMASHADISETLAMRESIILDTAKNFQPDIFIVDKEPMGLKGEVESTLTYLKTKGTKLVLGLRDVMDAPHLLEAEWKKKNLMEKIDRYFDDIWVYGPPDFYDPLVDIDVPASVRKKITYVGFLQRSLAKGKFNKQRVPKGDYILVTTGGGGDGSDLIHNVINAYQQVPQLTERAFIVLGPYMPAEERASLAESARDLPFVEIIEFDNHMEELIAGARAVVAMGGYNTYCEILSFDKPALIVPRVVPREEQLIRARRASELGLVEMLLPEEASDPQRMAKALQELPHRAPPSSSNSHMQLEGLPHISQIVEKWLNERQHHAGLVKLVKPN